LIAEGKITQGHARALLAISGEKKQLELADKIITEQLNVRQIEKMAKETKAKKKKHSSMNNYQIEINQLEERLKSILGTKVTIQHKKNKGKIEIEYYSNEELERILELLEK